MKLSSFLSSKLVLPVSAMTGFLVLILAQQHAEVPQKKPMNEYAVPVSLMPLVSEKIRPSVSGYGVVKATVELQQIAEISAKVTHLNPDLVAGATMKKEALLISLDDTDYRLALAQSEAQLENLKAQQKELTSNENSLKTQHQLVNKKLALAKHELQRKQNLAQVQSLSASQLDAEQQKLIALQQEMTSLDQQLRALPAKQQSLRAQMESAQAATEQQQRNIERTRIRMPFDGRIRSVEVEKDEFINQGQLLFQAIGIDQVEIEAQFSLDKLRPFIELAFIEGFKAEQRHAFRPRDMKEIFRNNDLTARISLPMAPGQFWHGEVVTLRETLDPDSYTLGAIIRVNKHYENLIPGKRPPLLAGLQVKAELMASEQEYLNLPLKTLHAGEGAQQWLYLAKPESENPTHYRLEKHPFNAAILTDNNALFAPQQFNRYQQQGYQLITNDLTPAINGMRLQAVK